MLNYIKYCYFNMKLNIIAYNCMLTKSYIIKLQ